MPRPRKVSQRAEAQAESPSNTEATPVKRGRGRPRKTDAAVPAKRGRGRPRKDSAAAPKAKGRPGRKPKSENRGLPVAAQVRPLYNAPQTAVVARLHTLISDTYTLMLATHHAHWNVEGPMFFSLHTLFETQYNELFLAVDELAERVRALGAYVYAGSYADILTGSTLGHFATNLAKHAGGESVARQMVNWLANAHMALAETAQALRIAAEKAGDFETADSGNARATAHQKAAWMLRSHLR